MSPLPTNMTRPSGSETRPWAHPPSTLAAETHRFSDGRYRQARPVLSPLMSQADVTSTDASPSSAAAGCSTGISKGAAAVKVLVLGSKRSTSSVGLVGSHDSHDPPMSSTRPSVRRSAVVRRRAMVEGTGMLCQLRAAASRISTLPTRSAPEPVTRTRPSDSRVAVWPHIGASSGGPALQRSVTGSKISVDASVVCAWLPEPPTTRTRPSDRRVAVALIRSMDIGGPEVHVPVAGSNNSVEDWFCTATLRATGWPPATRTRPSASTVDVIMVRLIRFGPAATHPEVGVPDGVVPPGVVGFDTPGVVVVVVGFGSEPLGGTAGAGDVGVTGDPVTAATATMGWAGGLSPSDPAKGWSEKLKMPPSAPTMRYPL